MTPRNKIETTKAKLTARFGPEVTFTGKEIVGPFAHLAAIIPIWMDSIGIPLVKLVDWVSETSGDETNEAEIEREPPTGKCAASSYTGESPSKHEVRSSTSDTFGDLAGATSDLVEFENTQDGNIEQKSRTIRSTSQSQELTGEKMRNSERGSCKMNHDFTSTASTEEKEMEVFTNDQQETNTNEGVTESKEDHTYHADTMSTNEESVNTDVPEGPASTDDIDLHDGGDKLSEDLNVEKELTHTTMEPGDISEYTKRVIPGPGPHSFGDKNTNKTKLNNTFDNKDIDVDGHQNLNELEERPDRSAEAEVIIDESKQNQHSDREDNKLEIPDTNTAEDNPQTSEKGLVNRIKPESVPASDAEQILDHVNPDTSGSINIERLHDGNIGDPSLHENDSNANPQTRDNDTSPDRETMPDNSGKSEAKSVEVTKEKARTLKIAAVFNVGTTRENGSAKSTLASSQIDHVDQAGTTIVQSNQTNGDNEVGRKEGDRNMKEPNGQNEVANGKMEATKYSEINEGDSNSNLDEGDSNSHLDLGTVLKLNDEHCDTNKKAETYQVDGGKGLNKEGKSLAKHNESTPQNTVSNDLQGKFVSEGESVESARSTMPAVGIIQSPSSNSKIIELSQSSNETSAEVNFVLHQIETPPKHAFAAEGGDSGTNRLPALHVEKQDVSEASDPHVDQDDPTIPITTIPPSQEIPRDGTQNLKDSIDLVGKQPTNASKDKCDPSIQTNQSIPIEDDKALKTTSKQIVDAEEGNIPRTGTALRVKQITGHEEQPSKNDTVDELTARLAGMTPEKSKKSTNTHVEPTPHKSLTHEQGNGNHTRATVEGDSNGPQANGSVFSIEASDEGYGAKSEYSSQNGITTRNSSDALNFSDDKSKPIPARITSNKGGKSTSLSNESPEKTTQASKPLVQDDMDDFVSIDPITYKYLKKTYDEKLQNIKRKFKVFIEVQTPNKRTPTEQIALFKSQSGTSSEDKINAKEEFIDLYQDVFYNIERISLKCDGLPGQKGAEAIHEAELKVKELSSTNTTMNTCFAETKKLLLMPLQFLEKWLVFNLNLENLSNQAQAVCRRFSFQRGPANYCFARRHYKAACRHHSQCSKWKIEP